MERGDRRGRGGRPCERRSRLCRLPRNLLRWLLQRWLGRPWWKWSGYRRRYGNSYSRTGYDWLYESWRCRCLQQCGDGRSRLLLCLCRGERPVRLELRCQRQCLRHSAGYARRSRRWLEGIHRRDRPDGKVHGWLHRGPVRRFRRHDLRHGAVGCFSYGSRKYVVGILAWIHRGHYTGLLNRP